MPVITISRMFGSGGSEVAAHVADALGWTLLDNALVERVAARLGRTPVEVQAIVSAAMAPIRLRFSMTFLRL